MTTTPFPTLLALWPNGKWQTLSAMDAVHLGVTIDYEWAPDVPPCPPHRCYVCGGEALWFGLGRVEQDGGLIGYGFVFHCADHGPRESCFQLRPGGAPGQTVVFRAPSTNWSIVQGETDTREST